MSLPPSARLHSGPRSSISSEMARSPSTSGLAAKQATETQLEETSGHFDRTKLIATLGPKSSTVEVVHRLIVGGADAIRVNFSHGDTEDHTRYFNCVKEASLVAGKRVCVLGDIQGPKLRISTFGTPDGVVQLQTGAEFTLDQDEAPGDVTRVCLPHGEFFDVVCPGDDILLNDGYVKLRALRVDRGRRVIHTQVTLGGKLSNRKGITVPTRVLPLSGLSEKDKRDIRNAVMIGMDYIALSFVQTAQDVEEARQFIDSCYREKLEAAGVQPTDDRMRFAPRICAKIEKPTAVLDIDEICKRADMIMVARGDLAIETCFSKVASLQKYILHKSREYGCLSCVATQILESMITSHTPTRAEVNDIASAVYDGAGSLLLTAETAAGIDPENAIKTLRLVVRQAELSDGFQASVLKTVTCQRHHASYRQYDAVALGAAVLSEQLQAKAIVVFTETGASTVALVRQHPSSPVLSLSREDTVLNRMGVCWGARAVYCGLGFDSVQDLLRVADGVCRAEGLAKPGDSIVVVFGTQGVSREPGQGCNNVLAHRISGDAGADARWRRSPGVSYGPTPKAEDLTPFVED